MQLRDTGETFILIQGFVSKNASSIVKLLHHFVLTMIFFDLKSYAMPQDSVFLIPNLIFFNYRTGIIC